MIQIAAIVLMLLIQSGPVYSKPAEINQQLYEAVNAFDKGAVKSLLKKGADPNSVYVTGYTPLMRAIEINQLKIVRQLLKGGGDPNLRARNGRSTAEIAVEAENPDIIETLLKGGADFNVKNSYGIPMVLGVIGSGKESRYEIVAAFGRHGVDMNLGTRSRTPLYDAISSQQDTKMVKLLLEAGADPNRVTENGKSPLASALSNLEILNLLLKAGADPNSVNRQGDPVLFQALFSVSVEAAEALIKAGADVNQPDSAGRTPLTRARNGGEVKLVKFLKRHGATDNEQEATVGSTSTDDEYPSLDDLPVYPGAQTIYRDDASHTIFFGSVDPVRKVAGGTYVLLEEAGWTGIMESERANRDKGHYYVEFIRGKFILLVEFRDQPTKNRTATSYTIVLKE